MRFWKWYFSMVEVEKMKSEAFQIIYALLKNPPCASENDMFQWWKLKKWHLRLFKLSMHFFKILYALLKMICFNDGILRKWNLRLLKSSMRFWKWNVSRTEYWENEILGFKNPLCASLKSFMRVWGWYISMMEGWENEIWDF